MTVTLLDPSGGATSSPLDGIHFDPEAHRAIGEAVAAVLKGVGDAADA